MAHRTCQAIILAAGQGTRMKSAKPKVLHEVAGLSMIGHVTKVARDSGVDLVSVIIGPDMDLVQQEAAAIHPTVHAHVQKERLGTGHAVLTAKPDLLDPQDDVLVLFGDTPLLKEDSLLAMRQKLAEGNDVVVLGFRADNPGPYGRLLEQDGNLIAIREAKDCTEEELKITFCNGGIMGFSGKPLLSILESLQPNNAQGEYYLTDAVEIANARGLSVAAIEAPEGELQGINNRAHLAKVEAAYQANARLAALENGATLLDPDSVYFSHDTILGKDVVIEQNVVFGPGVTIADDATIRAFSHLEGATISEGCVVGPYARLRPGTKLAQNVKIGNFVETKKANIEQGAKVNHLSYIGDARIGTKANIGAGTITCNYDGFDKFQTDIGAGAFIGSNTALVAPVKIGDGAIIGAGSVITRPVDADALSVTRASTVTKDGWAARFRAKKKK